MKNIVILGSTGSVGKQVLEVIRAHPKNYIVVGIAAQNSTTELISQIKEFKPRTVVLKEISSRLRTLSYFPVPPGRR